MCNLPADTQTVKSRFNAKHPGRPAWEERLSAETLGRREPKIFCSIQSRALLPYKKINKLKKNMEIKKRNRLANRDEKESNLVCVCFLMQMNVQDMMKK